MKRRSFSIPMYFDFHMKYLGTQFYLQRNSSYIDKAEAYSAMVAGKITMEELASNNSWIRHENKLGWSDGIWLKTRGEREILKPV